MPKQEPDLRKLSTKTSVLGPFDRMDLPWKQRGPPHASVTGRRSKVPNSVFTVQPRRTPIGLEPAGELSADVYN